MYVDRLYLKPISNGDYSTSLPLARHLGALGTFRFTRPVTILTGENGAGKSTLIEAMACRLGFDAAGGVQAEFNRAAEWTTSKLHRALVIRGSLPLINGYFLRSETQFNVANAGEPVARSHSESIMDVVERHFFSKGLFILDEPEVGLSPIHQMALLGYIDMIARGGGQFIIATHSPIILAVPGADIWHLSSERLGQVAYEDHPIYLTYRDFLRDPQQRILGELGRLR
ncbi:AAA family ATPase [Corynebacterium epidermidicanis]|nr:AAA family ATPase [Corynebacterium epidermidicanis]